MGHAKEVARLVVRHQAIDGFVANDDALLVIKLTRIWWHIAARHVHRLRVGHASHQLGCLPYGYISIGFVGHKVLGLAAAMDASLKERRKQATPMKIAMDNEDSLHSHLIDYKGAAGFDLKLQSAGNGSLEIH